MSNYIKKIKTTTGDLPIDYNSLANIPCYKTEPTETAILDQTVEEFLEWEGIYDSVATLISH